VEEGGIWVALFFSFPPLQYCRAGGRLKKIKRSSPREVEGRKVGKLASKKKN